MKTAINNETQYRATRDWMSKHICHIEDEEFEELKDSALLTEVSPSDDYDSYLPISGLWTFIYQADNDWLVSNEQKMIDFGFRVYKNDTGKYYFGIQGYGYNTVREHWVPLYEERQEKSLTKYQIKKEKVREEAIEWQMTYFSGEDCDLEEMELRRKRLIRLAKNYGLIQEFRENGIIGMDEQL